jgi:hypothetical protein
MPEPTDLSLPHHYLLVELHDATGKRLVDQTMGSYLLAGALVTELELLGRLVYVGADQVRVTETGQRSAGVLGMAEKKLGNATYSLKKAVYKLAGGWGGIRAIRNDVLLDLERSGAVDQQLDTFLFITWRRRYPTQNGEVEEELRDQLRQHMQTVSAQDPPNRWDALLSLLRAGSLLEEVWSTSELAVLKEAIDSRTDRAPIGRTIKTVVEEVQAAAVAAAAAV